MKIISLLLSIFYYSLSFAQTDVKSAPLANDEEIKTFRLVKNSQIGVGVLGGATTLPFYYDHNGKKETVYKYKKPTSGGLVDSWYPVGPQKITVCGTLNDYGQEQTDGLTPGDIAHTYLTKDRDYLLNINPFAPFRGFLYNRWHKIWKDSDKPFDFVHGEFNVQDLTLDPSPNKKFKDITSSTNPIFHPKEGLIELNWNKPIGIHGPWMYDCMCSTIFKKAHDKNEIHPINQMWFMNQSELILTAMVDGTGYFDISDANQTPASGKNLPMRFYLAFNLNDLNTYKKVVISGKAYNTPMPKQQGGDTESVSLYNNGKKLIEVQKIFQDDDVKKSFTVFFEGVRKLKSGKVFGYIVVETLPISESRGSITVNVKSLNGTLMESMPECAEATALSQRINALEKEIPGMESSISFLEKGTVIKPDYTNPGGVIKPIKMPPPKVDKAKIDAMKSDKAAKQSDLSRLRQQYTIVLSNCL